MRFVFEPFILNKNDRIFKKLYYGPSEVVKMIDLDGIKVILSKYKNWYTAMNVEKRWLLWYPSTFQAGLEIRSGEQVSFAWDTSNYGKRGTLYKLFGYVSDPHIVKMSLELVKNSNPERKEEAIGEDRMFIFYWLAQDKEYGITYLKGFDSNGNLIFQQ